MKSGSSVLVGLVVLAVGVLVWAWWGAEPREVPAAPAVAVVAPDPDPVRPLPRAAGVPGAPADAGGPPQVTAAELAARREQNARIRKMWEEGTNSGIAVVDIAGNALMVAVLCRSGAAPAIDQLLPMAKAHAESVGARDMLEQMDGIQDKWWFRTCVWLSPLVARDPEDPDQAAITPG